MTPATIAEAVEIIDDLRAQLKLCGRACDDLVKMLDQSKAAAAEAREDRDNAEAKLAHLQQVHAVSTATVVRLQSELAVAKTERDVYSAYAHGRSK